MTFTRNHSEPPALGRRAPRRGSTRPGRRDAPAIAFAAAGGVVALAGPPLFRAVAALALLTGVPGLALARALGLRRDPTWTTFCVAALSPAVLAVGSALAMLAGAPVAPLARALTLAAAVGVLALRLVRPRSEPAAGGVAGPATPRLDAADAPAGPALQAPEPDDAPDCGADTWRALRPLAVLAGVLVLLVGIQPQVDAAWRMRSDAWFHGAVVAELADFGAPPGDPYFAGFRLQYMWAYHALVAVVAAATRLDPFRVMAWINVQAVVALLAATWRLARTLGADRRQALGAGFVVPLALGGAFWLTFPMRAALAFTGNVRGWDELARQFRPPPFHYDALLHYLFAFASPELFLDKAMVATAFAIALSLLVGTWAAFAQWFRGGGPTERSMPVVAAVALAGVAAFHAVVAVPAFLGAAIAAALALVRTGPRRALVPVAAAGTAAALVAPVLVPILAARDGNATPWGIDPRQVLGAAIGCAAVVPLVPAAWRRLSDDAGLYMRAIVVAGLGVAVVLRLPGSNTYDKPVYFAYLPMAVLAGTTFADLWRTRRRLALAFVALCIAPANALPMAAAWNTPPRARTAPGDTALAAWARRATPREAAFVDRDDHVPLIVLAPRRAFFGRLAYARQWGYDRVAMAMRWHAARALTGAARLDATAFEALAACPVPLYGVLRGTRARARADSLAATWPDAFRRVYTGAGLCVVSIDRAACARIARSGELPRTSPAALVREARL